MNLTGDSSRVAVYHNEIHYLSKYLGDRSLDIANYIPWFLQWDDSEDILDRAGVDGEELEELHGEGDNRFYELCDQIQKVMSDEEKEEFVTQIVQDDPTEAPSWAHMDLRVPRLPRNTWLIHFSDDAYKISEEGFKYGVGEMDQIALTTWLHENTKKYGGYNFAFVAGSRDSIYTASSKKYGKHAVMFQASGLEVYHHGDEEHQVIFWGAAIDPRTTVELTSDGSEWYVTPRYKSTMSQKGRESVYKGAFKDVVDWVENHWFQYRKQIFGR